MNQEEVYIGLFKLTDQLSKRIYFLENLLKEIGEPIVSCTDFEHCVYCDQIWPNHKDNCLILRIREMLRDHE